MMIILSGDGKLTMSFAKNRSISYKNSNDITDKKKDESFEKDDDSLDSYDDNSKYDLISIFF